MRDDEFAALSKLVRERSGLALNRDKDYLLETRLLPVAKKHNFVSVEELTRALRERSRAEIERDVVEAMTTNESFFFRDAAAFNYLATTAIPELVASRGSSKRLRIWSAASSSGQEPYSISMIIEDHRLRAQGWQVEILCSDISGAMVERSRGGTYSHYEVQRGLPIVNLARYFDKSGTEWTIKPALRQGMSFQLHNLLEDFSRFGSFDIIFCRNVLIYFDTATKASVLDRLALQLAPDGLLFLGGAETVLGISQKFVSRPGQAGIFGHAPQKASLARAVGQ